MPKVIKDEVANQIANEVLALIKSKDASFKSNQIVAILNAARVIEMKSRPAKAEAAAEPAEAESA
jgi:hypothetical protein